MTKAKLLLYGAIAVVTFSVGFGLYGMFKSHKIDKAFTEYKAASVKSKETVDNLTKTLVEQRARADALEAQAKDKEKERDAAYEQLRQFGAQGKAAQERLKKSGEQFEVDANRIRASTDGCQLCKDTCAERAKLSTADFDVRCSPSLCDQYCAP